VARPAPAAAAESSARGRGDAVGLTSIFDRRQFFSSPNKSVFSLVNTALCAFAAERRAAAPAPAAIDRYLVPAQQQTHHTPLLRSNDMGQTDERTNGRTFDRYIDPTHTMRAASMHKATVR